jgi:hypothetical protein
MFSLLNNNTLYRFLNLNKDVQGVVVGKPITAISPFAFSRDKADGIRVVWLNDEITEIPDYCFDGLDSLEFIRISPATKRIGDNAFRNCTKLLSVRVPDGCLLGTKRYDGTAANSDTVFQNCPKLRKKFSPWIECVESEWHKDIPGGLAIFYEGGFLTSTANKNSWPNNFLGDTGLLISPVIGNYYRVMDINTMPTKRFPDKYVAKTRIIQVKA